MGARRWSGWIIRAWRRSFSAEVPAPGARHSMIGLPLAGLPLAGLPLAGLPLAGLPLAGLPLAGLPGTGSQGFQPTASAAATSFRTPCEESLPAQSTSAHGRREVSERRDSSSRTPRNDEPRSTTCLAYWRRHPDSSGMACSLASWLAHLLTARSFQRPACHGKSGRPVISCPGGGRHCRSIGDSGHVRTPGSIKRRESGGGADAPAASELRPVCYFRRLMNTPAKLTSPLPRSANVPGSGTTTRLSTSTQLHSA